MVLEPLGQFAALASTTSPHTAQTAIGERRTARRICLRGRASMNPGEVSNSSIHQPSIRKSNWRVTYSTGSESKQHPGSVEFQEQRDVPVANQKVGVIRNLRFGQVYCFRGSSKFRGLQVSKQGVEWA